MPSTKYEVYKESNMKPVLKVVAEFATEESARTRESEECHRHHATIFNMHDPSKGAKALKSEKKWKK